MSDIKYYHDLEQGTDEWLFHRLGIATGSEINELVTPKTGKQTTGDRPKAYAAKIASQRVNSRIEDSYQSYAMMKGHFHEVHARDSYNDNYNEVAECGFIVRDFGKFKIGCSPDGLVGDNGGIEIKNREPKFHVATIIADEVPAEYVNQCQAFLLVTGREWVDFISYSSGMPLFVKRVVADEARQETICDAMYDLEILVQKIEDIYAASSAKMVPTEYIECVFGDCDGFVTESTNEGD